MLENNEAEAFDHEDVQEEEKSDDEYQKGVEEGIEVDETEFQAEIKKHETEQDEDQSQS